MSITIKDIAKSAGVSVGTVDRVIHNRGRVSQETITRVNNAIQELEYKPNLVAKLLATKQTKLSIAVVLHIQFNDFYNDILRGIKDAENEFTYLGIEVDIQLGDMFDYAKQLDVLNALNFSEVDVLIITPINHEELARKLTEITEQFAIPVIFLNGFLEGFTPHFYVGTDYRKMGKIMGGLINLTLQDHDHNRIIIFSPSLKMLGHQIRLDGTLHALQSQKNIKSVAHLEVTYDNETDYAAAYDYFKNKDVTHIVCPGGAETESILRAYEPFANPFVKIFSYDFQHIVEEKLNKRIIHASILQDPHLQGQIAIRRAIDLLNGNPLENSEHYYVHNQIFFPELYDTP